MNSEIPVQQGKPASEDQQRLDALLVDIENRQLEFLDEGGKRLVELSATLIGIVFGVIALGDTFPPPYMEPDANKVLAAGALLSYLLAMIAGMWTAEPRAYKFRRHSASDRQRVLSEMLEYKSSGLRLAGVLFLVGSVCLAALATTIIFDL